MPQPLQVDTIPGFWDILGAIGDFFGGIFAGGALLIAALAYKRQVDDASKEAAAKVFVRKVVEDGDLVIYVENQGVNPISDVSASVEGAGYAVAGLIYRESIDAHEKWEAARVPGGNPKTVWAFANFRDPADRAWRRLSDGALQRRSNGVIRQSIAEMAARRRIKGKPA